MSTENEESRNEFSSAAEENKSAQNENPTEGRGESTPYGREGNERPRRPRFSTGASGRGPRNYDNDRPYRPRYNSSEENGGYQQRSYGNYEGRERNYRPRYNQDGGERRPRTYNNEEGERPAYRPRYNQDAGERQAYRPRYNRNEGEGNTYRPRYNQDGNNERPAYRPRYNQEGSERQAYRPRYNRNEGEGNTYRPHYSNREGERAYRPRYNQDGYNERPAYRSRYNQDGGERSPRPRFNNGDERRAGQGGNYGNRSGFAGNRGNRRPGNYNPNDKYSKKKQIEYKQQYVDPEEPIRLNKYLANAGVCSRREADEFIAAGAVTVNGEVVKELGTKIKRGDEVKFHDQPVSIERKIYILLNKPKDTVTTSDDPQERRTVLDLVKGACPERIYPVGRLDRNTTGVLLLTNDGDLASKLTHPKYLKKKVYQVKLDKNLTKADMDQIATGIKIDDEEIKADAIGYVDEAKKNEVGIEIHSGKNRIVRRIFETLGYKVLKLDRVLFAGLTKKGLRRGDWRFLTEAEVNFLRMGSFE